MQVESTTHILNLVVANLAALIRNVKMTYIARNSSSNQSVNRILCYKNDKTYPLMHQGQQLMPAG